ncbi:MAG TPA: nuclear transport factor 2 family protein [Anaerolineales bacterium]|nr:nuclear transport factor 2 family protein [Anaerolineales bacterium]
MSEHIRLLQDYLLSHNPARFFADDATLEDVLAGGIWRGWEAIDAWHRQASPSAVLEGQAELVRLIEGDGVVAAELLVVGAPDSNGNAVRLPMVGIYEVAGRMIHRARLYFDPARPIARTLKELGADSR